MFYNPLFEFETILEDQIKTSSILELFDDVMGKKCTAKMLKIQNIFLSKTNINIWMQSGTFHFLPTNIRQASFAMEGLAMKMIKELHVPKLIHGIIQNLRK